MASSSHANNNTYLCQMRIPLDDVIQNLKVRDLYDWHQLSWKVFPNEPESSRNFLLRIDPMEGFCRILILSTKKPVCPNWCHPEQFEFNVIPESFYGFKKYRFSLLVNPTKKVRSNASGERTKNGRRVGLHSREELEGWIIRKGETNGFQVDLDTLSIIPKGKKFFCKPGTRGAHVAKDFQGFLSVTDPVKFHQAATKGIGSAKAFGFGMLALCPIHSNIS